MTSITPIVKHRVRTTGLEHQGQNSISDPDQNLGLTCIFSSGMQETCICACDFATKLDSIKYMESLGTVSLCTAWCLT